MTQTNKKIVIIVQARMGSTRLPGKVTKEVLGRPLLSFLLERLKRVKMADEVVVATTSDPVESEIAACCAAQSVNCFIGSEEDVLDRYYRAAKHYHADIIVRVTGDCPLIDPMLINQIIEAYLSAQPECDYLSNTQTRTFPRGMDVEVFSFQSLQAAAKNADLSSEREHVTPYLYNHPELFKVKQFASPHDNSRYRWTVDTIEDFRLIAKILQNIYPKHPEFTLDDLLGLLEENPEWSQINADVNQKPL